jgi:hypothetical protein
MAEGIHIELDGRSVRLPGDLPGADCAGGYCFGLYKAGSTLLLNALEALTKEPRVKAVDVLRLFHQAGAFPERSVLSEPAQTALANWLDRDGVLYFGWRQFPKNYRIPLRRESRTFLLVRDPRDMITSHYFSLKYSHTTAGPGAEHVLRARQRLQTLDIDTWALSQAGPVIGHFRNYEALGETALKLCRYEDIVFDKAKLVNELCLQFGLDVSPARRGRIASVLDQRPAEENIHSHVRQVTPGDHRRKLKPSTIEQLNRALADVLLKYGYIMDF